MENRFKFGICVDNGYPDPTAERIKMVKRVGFDALFTGWSDGCDMEKWANEIARQGLIYQSVHAPFGHVDRLWEDPGEEGEKYADMLVRCIGDCARFDVKIMICHVIIGMGRHTPTELGLTRYARLVEEAERQGVTIAFENTEGMEYLEAVMKSFSHSPACGFCWDTGHEQCYNYGRDMMALYGDKLVGTHINDNFGMADRNVMTWLDDSHLMPFDGIIDWAGVAKRLDDHGFDDVMTMELTCKSKPGKTTHDIYKDLTCEEFFAQALERCRRVAALRRAD